MVFDAFTVSTDRGFATGFDRNAIKKCYDNVTLSCQRRTSTPHKVPTAARDSEKNLRLDILTQLNLGRNAHYTSNRHIHGVTILFGDQILEQMKATIIQSGWNSVMVDETTDISTCTLCTSDIS